MVNLLLVLNLERSGRQHHLDVGSDFLSRTLVKALKDPHHLEDGHQADEAWFLFGEPVCDDLRRACRLDGIILYQVAQQDIGIETDHFFCLNLCVAPASTAASISSSETGLAGFGMIPFSRDVGIFGSMITPSGWKKNLNRSPGLRCKRSRTALGIVACPLLLSVASMSTKSSVPYILAKVKTIAVRYFPTSPTILGRVPALFGHGGHGRPAPKMRT